MCYELNRYTMCYELQNLKEARIRNPIQDPNSNICLGLIKTRKNGCPCCWRHRIRLLPRGFNLNVIQRLLKNELGFKTMYNPEVQPDRSGFKARFC